MEMFVFSFFLKTVLISQILMMYNSFLEDLCALKSAQVYVCCSIFDPVAMGQFRLVSCNTASDILSAAWWLVLPCFHQRCSVYLAFARRSSSRLG